MSDTADDRTPSPLAPPEADPFSPRARAGFEALLRAMRTGKSMTNVEQGDYECWVKESCAIQQALDAERAARRHRRWQARGRAEPPAVRPPRIDDLNNLRVQLALTGNWGTDA